MTDKEKEKLRQRFNGRSDSSNILDFYVDYNNIPNVIHKMEAMDIHPDDFDDFQLGEICEGLESGLTENDVALYANPKFNSEQMHWIKNGLQDDNISYDEVVSYADEKYDADQMNAILYGYQYGVNVSIYANPKYDGSHMNQARSDLINGLNTEDIQRYLNNPSLTYSEMETISKQLHDGNMTESKWKKIETARDRFQNLMTGNTKIQNISQWHLSHSVDTREGFDIDVPYNYNVDGEPYTYNYSADEYYIYTDEDTFRISYKRANNKDREFNDEYTLEIKLDSPAEYGMICQGFAETHRNPDESLRQYKRNSDYGKEEYHVSEQCLDFINKANDYNSDWDWRHRRKGCLMLQSGEKGNVKAEIDSNAIEAASFGGNDYMIDGISVFSSDYASAEVEDRYAAIRPLKYIAEFCEKHKNTVLDMLETTEDKGRQSETLQSWQIFKLQVSLMSHSEPKDKLKTSDGSEHKGRKVTSQMESITERAENTETNTDKKKEDSPAD